MVARAFGSVDLDDLTVGAFMNMPWILTPFLQTPFSHP
jgi:hypothetical protein